MIYNIDNFPIDIIKNSKLELKPKGARKSKNYIHTFATFDIETSRFKDIDQSFMYIWQMCIGGEVLIGRTWDEFIQFCLKIKKVLDDRMLVVYVHNLSFEFQFLSGIYQFESDEVFCTEPRRILRCSMFDTIEFRCSLYLSNTNLDSYLKQFNVQDLKLHNFDYSKLRYPWTDLSDEELQYCIHDVTGLYQAISKHLQIENDTLHTIPLTSTGFPRRDIKKAMRHFSHYQMMSMQPNEQIYKMLKDSFRGGNTHANRFYVGQIIDNVKSFDRVSSYPDVMLNKRYPMKEFKITNVHSVPRVLELIKRGRSILMRICLWNVRLKNQFWGCPYISMAKCQSLVNPTIDNGRVLDCDYLECCINDIDLKILLNEYEFDDSKITECAISNYQPLPKQYREVILSYYKKKTLLKGAKTDDEQLQYNLAKSKLNACYGMSVQDIAKQSILYEDGEFVDDIKSLQELLDKNRSKAFTFYARGCWVSSWARFELEKAIQLCGDRFVYADTDSVKYFGDVDFSKYNDEQIKLSKSNNASAFDRHGNEYFTGVYELDGEYKKFKTLGAKKYAYIDMDDNLKITIAGVNKKKGVHELEESGGLDAMQEGFIFKEGGGNEVVYNDEDYGWHKGIYITKNITIKPSEYTLGLTEEYKRLLLYSKKLKYNPFGFKGL